MLINYELLWTLHNFFFDYNLIKRNDKNFVVVLDLTSYMLTYLKNF